MKAYYKKWEELPRSYFSDLHNYLTDHTDEFFTDPENKATDERDFETFTDSPVDRRHLVRYGEIMLVDMETAVCDHAYVICQVTRRKHKTARGRIVHLKILKSILPISNIRNKNWRAGYFLLPVLG